MDQRVLVTKDNLAEFAQKFIEAGLGGGGAEFSVASNNDYALMKSRVNLKISLILQDDKQQELT